VRLPGVTPRRLVLAAVAASIAVFCIVQDRIVAAGVGRYVALQRAAIAGPAEGGPRTPEGGSHVPDVTLDEVMAPAVRRSVRQASAWSGGVFAAGLALAAIRRAAIRRGGPSGPPGHRRGGPSGPPEPQ